MSYNGYYSWKNCCVKKRQCPTSCPTGPTGRIGLVGPIGSTGPIGHTGPSPFYSNGNLDISCNLIIDVSGIYFCDGTYIGHGNSFDISSNEIIHLKSAKDIVIDPSNVFGIKGNLDMCGNNIIDLSLNLNTNSTTQFVRYDVSTKQICHKSIDYASFSSDISQNLLSNTVKNLTYNTIDKSNTERIYYSPSEPSHIKFSQPGVYKIGTSVEFAKTSGSTGADVYLWFKNKGLDISNSASLIHLVGNDARTFNYVEIIYEIINSSDYIEISAFTSDTGVSAYAIGGNGNHPAVPSIITTVIQIS